MEWWQARNQKSSIHRPRLGPHCQIDPDFLPLPTSHAVEGDSSAPTGAARPGPEEGVLVFDRTVAFGPDGRMTLAAAALVQWWSAAADGSEGVAAETVFAALMRSGGDAASAAVSLILGAPSHMRAKIGELQPVQRPAVHLTTHRHLTAVAESQESAEARIEEIGTTRGRSIMDDVIPKAVHLEVEEKLHRKPQMHDKVETWPGWSESMSLEMQSKHLPGGHLVKQIQDKTQSDYDTMSASSDSGLERTTRQKRTMKVAALRVHQSSTAFTQICNNVEQIAPAQLEDGQVFEEGDINQQNEQVSLEVGVKAQPAELCSKPCSVLDVLSTRNLFQGTGIEAAPFWLVRAANDSLWQPAAANTEARDVATEKVSELSGGRRQGARNRIYRRASMVDSAASLKEKFRNAAGIRPKPLRVQRPSIAEGSRVQNVLALAHCGKRRCVPVSLGQEKRGSQEPRPPSSSSSLCSPPPSPFSKAQSSSQIFPAVRLCLDKLISLKDVASKVSQGWRQESEVTTAAKGSQAEEMQNVGLAAVLADLGLGCCICAGASSMSVLNQEASEAEVADDQHIVAASAAAAEAAALAADAEEAALAAEAEGAGTAARAVSAAELQGNTAALQGSAVSNQAAVTVKGEDADLVCDVTTAAQFAQPCKRPRPAAEVGGRDGYSRQTICRVTRSAAACPDAVARASACATEFNNRPCGESDTMISDSDDEGAVSGFGGSGGETSTPDSKRPPAGGFSQSSADGDNNPVVTNSARPRIAYKWAVDVTYCGTVVSARPMQQYKRRQV